MSDSRQPTVEEWIPERRKWWHDYSVRTKTMHDTSKGQKIAINAETFWSYMSGICEELESVYICLEELMNNYKLAIGISKGILGFSKPTRTDEILERAKDLGDFTNILMIKKNDWEAEEREKAKLK